MNPEANNTIPPLPQTAPAPVSPQISPASPPIEPEQEEENSSPFKKIIVLIVALFVILLVVGTGFGAYLLAYDKVTLTKYPDIQNKVTTFVMSVPFTPKTPKFILLKTLEAQSTVTSHSFDVSGAVDGTGSVAQNFYSKIDFEAKGFVDYSDPKNITFNLNADLTKDVNLDLSKIGNIYYFKVYKVDGFVKSYAEPYLKLETFLNQWYFYDMTPLQTTARQNLENTSEQKSISKEYADKAIKLLTDEATIKKIKVTNEKLNNEEVYKLTLEADQAVIDKVPEILSGDKAPACTGNYCYKLSDNLKDLTITVWVNQKTYNVLRADSQFKYGYHSSYGATSLTTLGSIPTTAVSLSATFSDFNKKMEIPVPSGAKNVNELTGELIKVRTEPTPAPPAL